ncbi:MULTISPECIES: type III effector [unclassified Pseudomonas]|uniref:type III effector n=1 Tax=unclassified Pseudomonas TaxID=196821 RepID=UPI0035BFCEAA
MPDLSVSQSQNLAALQAQQDAITPVSHPLAEHVRPSTTPLVPYHFTGKPSSDAQKALASNTKDLQTQIASLGKQDLAANPLGYAREHMKLEGMALGFAPGTGYQDMHQHLAGLGGKTHPMLSGHEETKAFENDLNAYLRKPAPDRKKDGGFAAVWGAHCARVGDTLGAYHSLCQEVIDTSEGHEDLPHLQRSHAAFRGYAKGVIKAITKDLPERLNTFLDSRIALAQEASGNNDLPKTKQDDARYELVQLRAVRTELAELIKKDEDDEKAPTLLDKATKANEGLDIALKNVAREDHIADLKTQPSFFTGLAVFADAGIPQGIASAGHFGAITAAIDEEMKDASFTAHVATTSAVLGASHKFISDGIRPFVQAFVDKTIGGALAKVDPTAVYPKPLRVVSENGKQVIRTEEQLNELGAVQQKKRDDFKLKQNANNFGTVSGDFTGYLSFGAAQAVRETVNQFTSVNASGIAARTIASAVGGTFMAGGHAVAKYVQTHGEEQIPTYRIKAETKTWSELLPETASGAFGKVNPFNMANASDYANRILGVGGGIAMRDGVANSSSASEDADATAKMHEVVKAFFISGLNLFPFFSNSPSAPLENTALHGTDKLSRRVQVPLNNIMDPNREGLPHTQPDGGLPRNLENVYHMLRGAAQLPTQGTISFVNTLHDMATSPKSTAPTNNIELAELGEAPALSNPSGEGPSGTKPT